MLKAIENEDIFPLVYVAITYGLRKSEVLGLKWDAVDFEKNTLEIKSTVVKNKTIVYKDTTKTESSHETYELLPEIKELLIAIKAEQNRNRKEYEELYTQTDYIFTQPDGRLYRPDSITRTFQRTLKRHGLPEMRFHDLRHSTASILFDKGLGFGSGKSLASTRRCRNNEQYIYICTFPKTESTCWRQICTARLLHRLLRITAIRKQAKKKTLDLTSVQKG